MNAALATNEADGTSTFPAAPNRPNQARGRTATRRTNSTASEARIMMMLRKEHHEKKLRAKVNFDSPPENFSAFRRLVFCLLQRNRILLFDIVSILNQRRLLCH